MTEQLLHLQRWIKEINESTDGYVCIVGYTITNHREESIVETGTTALEAARKAWKAAQVHYYDRRDNYYLKRDYVETDTPLRKKNAYEHKWNGHLLAWKGREWHCQHCDTTFIYKPGTSQLNCPKVKRYRTWDDIPENLKTASQLYELGYSKGKTQLPDAEGVIAWKNPHQRKADWQWLFLYPVEKAVKRDVTDSQIKALKKAHRSKGSTIEIIKAVSKILPSDYTVISEYEHRSYSLKIMLNDLCVCTASMGKNKKRAIQKAKVEAQKILELNDIYQIVEPLIDHKQFEFVVWKGNSIKPEGIYCYVTRIDEWEDSSRDFKNLEVAKQLLPLEIPEMIKEL